MGNDDILIFYSETVGQNSKLKARPQASWKYEPT